MDADEGTSGDGAATADGAAADGRDDPDDGETTAHGDGGTAADGTTDDGETAAHRADAVGVSGDGADGPPGDGTDGGRLSGVDWRLFGALFVAGMAGAAAAVPYQSALVKIPEVSTGELLVQALVLNAPLVAVAVLAGLVLAPGPGLAVLPDAATRRDRAALARRYGVAAGLGAAAAVAVLALDAGVFAPLVRDAALGESPVGVTDADLQARLLASLYGGVTEELLLRLGLLSALAWLGWRAAGSPDGGAPPAVAWGAVGLAALVFAAGHLPATGQVFRLTPAVVARALVLDGLGGVVFGWLYWRRDLTAAMAAHWTADVALLVVAPAVLAAG